MFLLFMLIPFLLRLLTVTSGALANSPGGPTKSSVEVVVQAGFASHASFVVLSPNQRFLLTTGWDNTVQLWDIAAGKQLRSFIGHTDNVVSAAFSPDGGHLVTASWDGTARFWQTATGKELHRFDCNRYRLVSAHFDFNSRIEPHRFEKVTIWVTSAVFSPDGRYILTASHDALNRLWDAHSGKELKRFAIHVNVTEEEIRSLSWPIIKPDAERLAHIKESVAWTNGAAFIPRTDKIVTITEHGEVIIWNARTKQEVQRFRAEMASLRSLSISPRGDHILTTSSNGSVSIWNVWRGTLLKRFTGHNNRVNSSCFSADGTLILTASDDNTARLWSTRTWREKQPFLGHTDVVNAAILSHDQRWVITVSGDGTARMWDSRDGTEIRRFTGYANRGIWAALSADGNQIVSVGGDKSARLWDRNAGALIRTFAGHTLPLTCACISPDGSILATSSLDDTVRLWNLQTGVFLRSLIGHSEGVDRIVFLPDGHRLLTTPHVGTETLLWDTDKGRILRRFEGREFVAVSRNGARVATGDGNAVLVWDLETGERILRLKEHRDTVLTADFSPDGKQLITGSTDQTALIWDVETGKPLRQLRWHQAPVLRVAFAENGQQVLTCGKDNTVCLWNSQTVRSGVGADVTPPLWSRNDHNYGVVSACFSPDGYTVFTLGGDGALVLRARQNGEPAAVFVTTGSEDFVIATTQGYYRTSRHGGDGVAFRIRDHVFPFEQFDFRWNRPDKVLEELHSRDDVLRAAYKEAYQRRAAHLPDAFRRLVDLTDLPHVELLAIPSGSKNSRVVMGKAKRPKAH